DNTVASPIQGAKNDDHACLPQPGEEMFRWTSSASTPNQYRVEKCPTEYDSWVCRTIFGSLVVPEVKYTSISHRRELAHQWSTHGWKRRHRYRHRRHRRDRGR